MNKILVEDHYLPYLIDEELYVVEEKFKKELSESKAHLSSTEADTSNAALPNMVKSLLLIIRFESENDNISSYKTFLSKLLAAAGYRLPNVDIVVMNKLPDVKAKTIIENSQAQHVMAFGVDVKNPENFQIRQFSGKHIIISAPIERLPNSRANKTKLWGLMKEMFKLE